MVSGDFAHDTHFPAALWCLHPDSPRREVFGQHTDVGYRALRIRLCRVTCFDLWVNSEDAERQDKEEAAREETMKMSPNRVKTEKQWQRLIRV
jgi:hypothetical protein